MPLYGEDEHRDSRYMDDDEYRRMREAEDDEYEYHGDAADDETGKETVIHVDDRGHEGIRGRVG